MSFQATGFKAFEFVHEEDIDPSVFVSSVIGAVVIWRFYLNSIAVTGNTDFAKFISGLIR